MLQRPVVAFVVAGLLAGGPASMAAQSQATPPPAQTQPAQAKPEQPKTDPSLPVDVEKIKNALERFPAIHLDDSQLRFYTTVTAKVPTFEDFVGNFDLRNGPVPRAGMTHQEFLNMVTPKELYSSAGITATEMLQFAITNWAAQTIIRKGLQEIREARSAREIQQIRDRINRELAALAGK